MNSLLLSRTAVVLVANGLDTPRLGPDFLIHNGVFPADLAIVRNFANGPISQVEYADNYVFQAQPERVIFTHSYDPNVEFRGWDGDMLGASALSFLGAPGPHSFTKLGINLDVIAHEASVASFFSTAALQRQLSFFDLTCRTEADGFDYLQLKLETAVSESAVKASANFHLDLPEDDPAGAARVAIERRMEAVGTLISILDELPL